MIYEFRSFNDTLSSLFVFYNNFCIFIVMIKTAIFIDVQNIYYTVMEQYNSHFNYQVFYNKVSADRKIIKAYAYATDRGDKKQQNFQNILRNIGFDVKLKPFIQRSDGSAKGDWDVGISLDIMECAEETDEIILASGDGDFTAVIEKVIKKAKVIIYGVPGLTAGNLIQSCNLYVPIQGELLLPIPANSR